MSASTYIEENLVLEIAPKLGTPSVCKARVGLREIIKDQIKEAGLSDQRKRAVHTMTCLKCPKMRSEPAGPGTSRRGQESSSEIALTKRRKT
jgi:hypothetical protein